jgi:hypothetical protein
MEYVCTPGDASMAMDQSRTLGYVSNIIGNVRIEAMFACGSQLEYALTEIENQI